jgi:hypothetical protein
MMISELRERMQESEFVIWSRYYALKAQREELERAKAGG